MENKIKVVKYLLSGSIGLIAALVMLCIIGRIEGDESFSNIIGIAPCLIAMFISARLTRKYDF